VLPNKIWGFVDLRALPQAATVSCNEMQLEPTVYAVVENAYFVQDKANVSLSELFVPITKEIGGLTNNAVSHMKFYLADVDAIVKAIAVIPDIGGQANDYFILKDRETWRTDFMHFLLTPLDLDAIIEDDDDFSD
jgi:hypothetical protein